MTLLPANPLKFLVGSMCLLPSLVAPSIANKLPPLTTSTFCSPIRTTNPAAFYSRTCQQTPCLCPRQLGPPCSRQIRSPDINSAPVMASPSPVPASLRAMQSSVLAQPDYVFNPGAPIARDLAQAFYNLHYLRDINARRVFVIDAERRAVLLTTPMRVMAAWRARTPSQPAPYLSVSGWQPSIPEPDARRFLDVLAASQGGSLVVAAGRATWHAINVSRIALSTAHHAASAADVPEKQLEPVWKGLEVSGAGWVRMVSENLAGVEMGTCFVADEIDFDVPDEVRAKAGVLLLREEESEVAMGAPMITMPSADSPPVDGIQFRGGYGARWDTSAQFTPLRFPFYSPRHRPPVLNRIWVFASSLIE